MFRRTLSAAGAAAAIVIAGPAFGQGHGGGHGPSSMPGPAAGPLSQQPTTTSTMPATTSPTTTTTSPTTTSGTSFSPNSQAVTHSQGPSHASPTGIAHASPNSVLSRGAVSSTTLPGLTSGLTVQNSTGTTIGTVSQVITGSDGSIRAVVVTSPTGQTFRLAPTTLSISGGVVTTTSTTTGG
jgi:hypothetical protein